MYANPTEGFREAVSLPFRGSRKVSRGGCGRPEAATRGFSVKREDTLRVPEEYPEGQHSGEGSEKLERGILALALPPHPPLSPFTLGWPCAPTSVSPSCVCAGRGLRPAAQCTHTEVMILTFTHGPLHIFLSYQLRTYPSTYSTPAHSYQRLGCGPNLSLMQRVHGVCTVCTACTQAHWQRPSRMLTSTVVMTSLHRCTRLRCTAAHGGDAHIHTQRTFASHLKTMGSVHTKTMCIRHMFLLTRVRK